MSAVAHATDLIHLSAAGVSLVLDLRENRLPRVLHWGAALPEMTSEELTHLAIAAQEPAVNGELDERYGVSVMPEHSWGWMGTPGLVGHRDGRDHSTRFVVSDVSATEPGAESGGGDLLTITAADAVAELVLRLEIQLLPSGLLRARAALSSTGHGSADDGALYTVDALTLMMPVPREADELLDFSGRWIRERTPQRRAFVHGTHLRETRRGKPGLDSAFLLSAGSRGFGFRSGEVWSTHVAWSGNARMLAERGMHGLGVIGGGELLYPGEVRMAPGDEYAGPWVYWTHGEDGLDGASARIHAYMRARPHHPRRPRPVTVNTWEAVYFDHDASTLSALAEAAAAVGAERFVLDDGWFQGRRADDAGLGDWFVDADVYPDGLRPLADEVRAAGMEFGLWVEPEMVNPDSVLAREHPEWIAQSTSGDRRAAMDGTARLPLEARRQHVLDLTQPGAYAYIEERLHALVAELEPAYLKWDHNRDLLEAGSTRDGRPIGRRQTLAFYRLLDGLRTRFPGLEIESCASGGGRIDLEVLERTDRVWTSDCNDALERQRIQRWTSLLVPPEYMGAHIGPPTAHSTGRTHTLDFRASTAIWGHLGIEWNVAGPEASEPENRRALAEWIALHKRHRALLHSGVVVRSDFPEPGRLLHGVVAQDGSEALFCFASMDSVHTNPVGMLRLPGLDPHARYRVTREGPVELWPAAMRARTAWWVGGVEASGQVLTRLGVQAPAIHPEEALLLRAVRI